MKMNVRISSILVLVSTLSAIVSVQAATDEEVAARRARLLEQIRAVEHDPARLEEALNMGSERTMLCASCHGKDGNSVKEGVPNLAGQNPAYLLEQIEKFADGRRQDFVMQTLSANFTMEDKINIALYYEFHEVDPVPVDASLAQKGKDIYASVCQGCHGEGGKGEAGYARIAGQRIDYVTTTLKRFRDNHLVREKLADVKRSNPLMEQVTQNLSDEDINALANYVASLR